MYSKDEIYEIPNPMWLDDTFVFDKQGRYIKVDCIDKITEIGTNILKRLLLHKDCSIDRLLHHKQCSVATKQHRKQLRMIGGEYFEALKNLE